MQLGNLIMTYLGIIQKTLPNMTEDLLLEDFSSAGVDSFDLLAIRVEVEAKLGKEIPDTQWVSFKTLADIVKYCGGKDGAPLSSFQESEQHQERMARPIVVGMPQMALEALSENWLMKELGSNHWDLLCAGLNTSSGSIQDEMGNRLYATFARVQFTISTSLAGIEENESFSTTADISRYGEGMYFSKLQFTSESTPANAVMAQLMTSFSRRVSLSANDLVKSKPEVPVNEVKNEAQFPEFGDQYRLYKKGLLTDFEVQGYNFEIVDEVIHESQYELNPYHDINGAGLLYFAAYPTISDICEARHFNSLDGNEGFWEMRYSTVFRDVLYFANCNLGDVIVYRIHTVRLEGNMCLISSSLTRQSDGVLMARLHTVKMLRTVS